MTHQKVSVYRPEIEVKARGRARGPQQHNSHSSMTMTVDRVGGIRACEVRSELDSLVIGEGRLTPVACFECAKGGGPWGLPWPGDDRTN